MILGPSVQVGSAKTWNRQKINNGTPKNMGLIANAHKNLKGASRFLVKLSIKIQIAVQVMLILNINFFP